MDQNQYRALLEEVRNDMAEVEKTLAELAQLEGYLLKKLDGEAAPRQEHPAARARRAQPEESAESEGSRQGMQTVEFGPDGFPSS